MKNSLFLILISVLLFACSTADVFIRPAYQQKHPKTEPKSEISKRIYLIGDVGEDTAKSAAVLGILKKKLVNEDPKNSSVIFLGDNIYPEGLHPKDHPMRAEDERRIDAQINAVSDYDGEIIFIPGNHDWQRGGEEGFAFNNRQEKYIQKRLKKVYRPSHGCSGPNDVEIGDDLAIILIDTQWWLHKYKKGRGEIDDCDYTTEKEFLAAFQDLLKKHRNKHVIVAGHHPLYSNGRHGGYYPLQDHLFPLRNLNKAWTVPLPIIGSIYPFYRSYFGNLQDIAHPRYQQLKQVLVQAMSQYDNVIYAAGHEHNLQYFFQNRTHYVVSGAGSKKTHLHFNNKLDFGAVRKGLAVVDIYKNGDTYLTYLDENEVELFHQKIYNKRIKGFEGVVVKKQSYKGQYKTVVPDSAFAATKFKRLFFGDLNRELWTQPVKIPYLDIHYVHGGLTPQEKGGGQQSISLKMKGGNGRKYKLRGIKKSADFLVERDMRGTMAQNVIYDGIGGSHPYASVAIPKLADAASIYYTKPELVYIPKDSILGDYLEEFGGMFALLELHPNDDMSDMDNFGNSKEVVNYMDAIKEMQKNHNHVVDVNFVVRARLLDMFIGDWDRHDDQWRWATFKVGDQVVYRPIPRDRDQAFFQFDGVVMNISNRKWLLKKFQPFRDDVRDIAGLCFNARYFDRAFLVEADLDSWVTQAKYLQENITDEVIRQALEDLPSKGFEVNGEEIIQTLINRRAKLTEFAERYYNILSREADITGTIEKDYFEVNRLENGDVEVAVYPRKGGKKVKEGKFFQRTFKHGETKEIRLYGLGDKDEFKIKGNANKSILVRIIAGEKKDKIVDESNVKSWVKKTRIYEVAGELDIEESKETKVRVEKPENAYYYDRKAFKYDKLIPLPSVGFNLDDGFYFGAGFTYIKHGFKKQPYAQKHSLFANYALKAEGFNVGYQGNFKELLGRYDYQLNVLINQPSVYQFYGEGNETQPTDEQLGNSQVRINNYQYKSVVSRASKNLSSSFNGGLEFQFTDIEDVVISDTLSRIGQVQEFITASFNYTYNNIINTAHPNKGVIFSTSLENTQSLNNDLSEFFRLRSSLTFYVPLNNFRKQATLAFRTGYAGNFGDYQFFQANFLSGLKEVRGLPRNRFAGKSVAYGNAEFRKSFLKVQNYVMPFDFGITIHGDMGRVWIDDDQSDRWHNAYGGGIFFNMLDYFSVVASYTISDTDRLINFGTGFYF